MTQPLSRRLAIGVLASAAAAPALAKEPPQPAESGFYAQPWFLNSFLDLREDAAEAAQKGKRLVLMWEQRGCLYCKEFHAVHLANSEIVAYFRAHFEVLALDLHGQRRVKDFDGQELAEKDLAARYAVRFTPTFHFFPKSAAIPVGRSGRDAEEARLPGLIKPFPFYAYLHYVAEGQTKTQKFDAFLKAMHDASVRAGGKAHLW